MSDSVREIIPVEKIPPEVLSFESYVVLDTATNKAICYLDKTLGEELHNSIQRYERDGYQVYKLGIISP